MCPLLILALLPSLASPQGPRGGVSLDEKLFAAIQTGDAPRVKALLAKGANPNATQANGWTPLLSLGSDPASSLAIARLLVAGGAEVNYRQPGTGDTPLLKAVVYRNGLPLVSHLLDKGAKPDLANIHGITPLRAAMSGPARSRPSASSSPGARAWPRAPSSRPSRMRTRPRISRSRPPDLWLPS